MEGKRVLKWDSNYTYLKIVKNPNELPDLTCKIVINDYGVFLLVSNTKYMHEGITVFSFLGEVFAGRNSKLNLKIYEYPNGVRQAELTVIKIQD